jgi:hypothetical protein
MVCSLTPPCNGHVQPGTWRPHFFGGTGGLGGRVCGAAGGCVGLGAGVAAGFGALG